MYKVTSQYFEDIWEDDEGEYRDKSVTQVKILKNNILIWEVWLEWDWATHERAFIEEELREKGLKIINIEDWIGDWKVEEIV